MPQKCSQEDQGLAYRQGAIACREGMIDDCCPYVPHVKDDGGNPLRRSWMDGFHETRIAATFGPLFRQHGA